MPRPRDTEPKPTLVRREGRRNWYIQWTPVGTRRSQRYSTGETDEEEAKQVLATFNARLAAPPDSPTVSEILDAYLADRKGKVMAYSRLAEAAVALKAKLGHLQPEQVTSYSRGVSNGTIRREIGTFRAAMNLAVKRRWIDRAPDIDMPPASAPRDRYLTRDEARRLIECTATAHTRLFMQIGFATGARKNAILNLTWERVDWERSWLDFNEPGRPVTDKRRPEVRVGQQLMAALQTAKKLAQTDYVIEYHGKGVSSVKTAWRNAAAEAGVSWSSPHVMKHTVISWLAEDGFSVDQIADLTATSHATVRRIYRKFNPDYLADAATALELSIGDVCAPTGRTNQSRKVKGK